ncbi:penicillin-binding transpeptidase domain-containing protein [Nonomuraea sp. NPDC049309]|uniref:penicillin-binding transpeptidase domain-containing protein n=1 Tax=Nonomuraea sp. NPDC049309 TaxID=3364350 RepID=UPI00371B9BA4
MAGSRARWINVPLARVARLCSVLLFVLLAHLTLIQEFGAGTLNADPRNERTLIDRYARPRGDIRTYDGTVIATSRLTEGRYRYQRVYPQGARYAAVTGHLSLRRATGIEQAEEPLLTGDDPKVKVRSLVSGGGAGAHVRLTIRDRVQLAAYQGLAAAGLAGAAVAIDPASGAVLALVTAPTYDPNTLATFDRLRLAAAATRLRESPDRPLLNRALNRLYPPGATFKLVTTAAALASGEYTPSALLDAPARLRLPGSPVYVRDTGCGAEHPTLLYAFQAPCDTAFAGIGLQLGQDLLRDQAEAFGFNAGELRIPLAATGSRFPVTTDRSQTALAAIGQHDNRATPLMVAMLSAAVANDGVLMRPYLVEDVRLADGAVISRAVPAPYRTVMPPALARYLAAMMATAPSSGSTSATVAGVRVAMKAATSPPGVPGAQDLALVTAFAPAEAPEVAVGVVLERPGTRSHAATAIARAIIQAALS